MAAQEDIESVAGQLATLTHTVEEMAKQLTALRGRAIPGKSRPTFRKNASTSQPASSPR
jgi:hypothetical protein